jgi:hypothetical protein
MLNWELSRLKRAVRTRPSTLNGRIPEAPHPPFLNDPQALYFQIFIGVRGILRFLTRFNLSVFSSLLGCGKLCGVFSIFEALKSLYPIYFHKVIAKLC